LLLGLDPVRAGSVTRVSEDAFMVEGAFCLEGNGVVLGVDLARELGCVVGDRLLVHSPRSVTSLGEVFLPEEVEVRGIFNLGMRDFDAGFVLASIDVVGELVGMDAGASAIYVMTEEPLRFESYAAAIRSMLGPRYHVATWKDIDRMLFDALAHEKSMMFIVLLFITIVAIFCVTNTLIVISVNKTHEIGLLKALGFATRRIMAVFMWHGWIQCMIGTVLGIGVGLTILLNLDRIVAGLARLNVEIFPKGIYGLDGIPWHTTWQELAFIAVLVMVICTCSSLLPVWLAARRDPVDALRQE
jgi:lipoprotein-releasing system permease protein